MSDQSVSACAKRYDESVSSAPREQSQNLPSTSRPTLPSSTNPPKIKQSTNSPSTSCGALGSSAIPTKTKQSTSAALKTAHELRVEELVLYRYQAPDRNTCGCYCAPEAITKYFLTINWYKWRNHPCPVELAIIADEGNKIFHRLYSVPPHSASDEQCFDFLNKNENRFNRMGLCPFILHGERRQCYHQIHHDLRRFFKSKDSYEIIVADEDEVEMVRHANLGCRDFSEFTIQPLIVDSATTNKYQCRHHQYRIEALSALDTLNCCIPKCFNLRQRFHEEFLDLIFWIEIQGTRCKNIIILQ